MSEDKSRMYNAKPKKAASKVITMAGQDHQVMSPEEFMRFRGEFSKMQSDISHMKVEMQKMRNHIRQQDQRIQNLSINQKNDPFDGKGLS